MQHIFAKYCTPQGSERDMVTGLLVPPQDAYLSAEGLDAWARDTNGAEFSEETKKEVKEYLDVTERGDLTLVCVFGFLDRLTGVVG